MRLEITQEYLQSVLNYNKHTGEFTWKPREIRSDTSRTDKTWNARYAGTVAGNLRGDGYVKIGLLGNLHSAHRLAWLYCFGEWPSSEIDHKNGDSKDNRIDNLREATRCEQNRNRRVSRKSTTGLKGVKVHNGCFQSSIRFGGKERHLGSFKTAEEAHAAYAEASRRLHGQFSRVA